jgi:hypothetical protein
MTFLRNLALFFVLFLPLTFAVSLGSGLLAGPAIVDGELTFATPYPVAQWLASVFVLALPSVLLVLPLHWLRRAVGRRAAMATLTALAFLALVVMLFGRGFLTGPVLLFIGLPAAVYGAALSARSQAG